MKARVLNAEIGPGRLIAISDIHGNLPYLKGLIETLNLSCDDTLVFVGDIIEKGDHSLETLRYLLGLKDRYRVYAVLGNCDGWSYELDNPRPMADRYLHSYILNKNKGKGRSILAQMANEIGFPLKPDFDMNSLRQELIKSFKPELDFMRETPHVLYTPRANFVHGGLPAGPPDSWDAWDCMKNDCYLKQNRAFPKWLIVGHTPSVLYDDKIACANPIIDYERKIASIDGGCVLADDGQLNALIIDADMNFSFCSYDSFPKMRVLDSQSSLPEFFFLRWGDSRVSILTAGEEFSLVRHERTGYELTVLSSYLRTDANGNIYCRDVTDYLPKLCPGDIVSVIEDTSAGYYIKHKGICGWYHGRLESI
ncbi:MAG: serine/threonine protein phosphatase [Ruminococcaceae bacterium]|nr:serine/threonine protein phosphatase [Oscillospiraceae bacterium]